MNHTDSKLAALLLLSLSVAHTACLVPPPKEQADCDEEPCPGTGHPSSTLDSTLNSSESGTAGSSGSAGTVSTTTGASTDSSAETQSTDSASDTTGSNIPDPPPGMVLVPAGGYWYGCDPNRDIGCHKGTFELQYVQAEAIFADIYETTVEAYVECIYAGACLRSGGGSFCNEHRAKADVKAEQDPINCVTYTDAENYCHWANKRLPTEREWVRMARGPESKAPYPWGSLPEPECPNVIVSGFNNVGCNAGHTWPVGREPEWTSPLGIHDLLGNVREWTSDDATDSLPGSKSIRGQHYRTNTSIVPAIYRRDADLPENENSWTGFRCVQDIPARPRPR